MVEDMVMVKERLTPFRYGGATLFRSSAPLYHEKKLHRILKHASYRTRQQCFQVTIQNFSPAKGGYKKEDIK